MEEFKKFFKSKLGIAIVFVSLLSVVGIGLWYSNFQKSLQEVSAPISQNQIMIQRGNDVVIVNDNGLVEYRLESGVYFDNWDMDKVRNFFSTLQAKARASKGQTPPGGNYYTVTLYVDGELVTIYVEEGDELIDEVFEDTPGGGGGGFDFDFDDDSPPGGSSPSPTPTPIPTNPGTVSAGGGAGGGGGGGTSQDEFNCNINTQTVAGKTNISNTICQVSEP